MRNWALGAFVAGLVAFVVFAVMPFFGDQHDFPAAITSPPPLVSVALDVLHPGERLCMGRLAAERHSQVGRLKVGTYGKPGPPLELSVTGPGYRSAARVGGGYADNSVTAFHVQPPPRAMLVTVCARNAGRVKVALYSAADRAESRAAVSESGHSVHATPQFGFWEAKQRSIGERLPLVVDRMATFRGPLGYGWVVWVVLALFVFGLPLGLAGVVWAGAKRETRRF